MAPGSGGTAGGTREKGRHTLTRHCQRLQGLVTLPPPQEASWAELRVWTTRSPGRCLCPGPAAPPRTPRPPYLTRRPPMLSQSAQAYKAKAGRRPLGQSPLQGTGKCHAWGKEGQRSHTSTSRSRQKLSPLPARARPPCFRRRVRDGTDLRRGQTARRAPFPKPVLSSGPLHAPTRA